MKYFKKQVLKSCYLRLQRRTNSKIRRSKHCLKEGVSLCSWRTIEHKKCSILQFHETHGKTLVRMLLSCSHLDFLKTHSNIKLKNDWGSSQIMYLLESYSLRGTLKSIFFARLKAVNSVQNRNKPLIHRLKSYWLTSIWLGWTTITSKLWMT